MAHLKPIPTILSVLLIAGTVAGCMDSGQALTADAPRWESGFSFSFNLTYNLLGSTTVNGVTQESRQVLGPFINRYEVLNTTLEANGEPVYILGTVHSDASSGGPVEVPSEEAVVVLEDAPGRAVDLAAFRQRDLAPLDLGVKTSSVCRGQEGQQQLCQVTQVDVDFGDPPAMTYLEFPLRKGKSWSGQLSGESAEIGEFGQGLVWDVRAKVQGARDLNLPVGLVRTVPVEFAYRPSNAEAIEQGLRASIAQEGGTVQRLEFQASSLMTAYYSSEYQCVVRTTVSTSVVVDLSATGPDGSRLDYRIQSQVQGEEVLTGARLADRPERDWDQIGKVLSGLIPVDDPTGSTIEGVDYALDLVASQQVVNAAESPTVDFSTLVVGAPALPEKHEAAWRVLDAAGATVTEGTGLNFSHQFSEPGLFLVEVAARSGRSVTAVDSVQVVADYRSTIDGSCEIVGAEPLVGGCSEIAVPVRPGIQRLRIAADVGSPVGPLARAELELRDPADRSIVEPGGGAGQFAIEVEDFDLFVVDGRDWTLDWRQYTTALQQVSFTLELSYGPAPAGPPDPPGDARTFASQWLPATGWAGLDRALANLHEGALGFPGVNAGHDEPAKFL